MRLTTALVTAAVSIGAPTVALAADLLGTAGPDHLVGTPRADAIDGRAGNDTLLGLGGSDLLVGGLGRDRISGGAGNDAIAANGDGAADTVACGAGKDLVDADPGDKVARDCEVTSRQLSTDVVSGGGGQHATEVEPDSFSYGTTMLAAFQVGRVASGGATAIGIATSTDGARHWRSGLLPGVTASSPRPGVDSRTSDPSVGYDAVHGVWLVASLGIAADHFDLLVNRSPDGIAWTVPVVARRAGAGALDKEWIACDNWPASPNRGRCYLSYLDVASNTIVTQTTTDGGATWGPPAETSLQPASGLEPNGAQPLPRPDGSLVVVYELAGSRGPTLSDELLAAPSLDGGATFGPSVRISGLTAAPVPSVRAPSLPSADVAADGTLFVAWHDCRLDTSCARNRILVSSSPDGVTWSNPVAVAPAAAATTAFVPGLAVDPAAAGAGKRLAVVYYTLTAACAAVTSCGRVDVWLATSPDGGITWRAPQRLDAQPMQLQWLPEAGGRFLGDYLSTSFVAGRPVPVYSLAVHPWGGKLRDAVMALQTG